MEALNETPLHALHLERGAKMVPFAGYAMPVSFPLGVLKEHLHTRSKAGLFDVSHMGQATLTAKNGDYDVVASALETIVPGEFRALKPSRIRYSMLLNDEGGILDDIMAARDASDGALHLVVNAGVKDRDYTYLRERLGDDVALEVHSEKALLALQGPAASKVLAKYDPELATMPFMSARRSRIANVDAVVSRCGYTGEDGFELSVDGAKAVSVSQALLDHDLVEPIGLGARDSLRLEAGLCLYGSDIDETTSPVEADLTFAIGKRRRREGGFAGAERILSELQNGPKRRRVLIAPEGRAPARAGVKIHEADGAEIGAVTSGGFGPSAEAPVAMGYVAANARCEDGRINLKIRGKDVPARIVQEPFSPHRYYRG
ncbi:MAG: glycine cleavage system aminomethyltransferase GcvT [Pseudomonadota bacterium]